MILKLRRYIIRRLLSVIPTMFGLSFLIFCTIIFFPPEFRVQLFLSAQRYYIPWAPDPTEALIKQYGLDDPFYIQYMRWLEELLNGSLGFSHLYNKPITEIIYKFFPATLELVIWSAPIIFIGGYKLGCFTAKRAALSAPREDPIDFAVRTITTIGYSIPPFVFGLILLVIFYLGLGWGGVERLGLEATIFVRSTEWTSYTRIYTIDALLNGQLWIFFDALKHLVLPVITLSTQMIAIVARITRTSMIDELGKPYIITAKAKGLREGTVMNHAKKGARIPVFTITGILFASMLTGLIVTEYIFAIRGVGYLVVEAAAKSRIDFALLVGLALVFCAIFLLINLVVDIVYAFIDPRVEP